MFQLPLTSLTLPRSAALAKGAALTSLSPVKKAEGIIVAFSFGKGAYEEIARAKLHDNLDIKALEVKQLLKKQEQQLI